MRNVLLLMLIFVATRAASQTFDAAGIELSILGDTLTAELDRPRLNLEFNITNGTDSNLIMYELNSAIIRDGLGVMDPYCNQETTSAAIILYVLDVTHKPVTAIHWYVNDLRNPITKERFDSIMSTHKESYLERTVMLEKHESKKFAQEVNMQEFHLERGQYFIQLLYFAGNRIRNFVMEKEILADKKHFDAQVFQGCLISNKCVLLVK